VCWTGFFFFLFSFGWPDNCCGVSLLAEEVILERRTLGNSHLVFSLFLRVIDTWQLIVWGSHKLSMVLLIVEKIIITFVLLISSFIRSHRNFMFEVADLENLVVCGCDYFLNNFLY